MVTVALIGQDAAGKTTVACLLEEEAVSFPSSTSTWASIRKPLAISCRRLERSES
jgi:hypothetical protein